MTAGQHMALLKLVDNGGTLEDLRDVIGAPYEITLNSINEGITFWGALKTAIRNSSPGEDHGITVRYGTKFKEEKALVNWWLGNTLN